jgi:hypothetical protein
MSIDMPKPAMHHRDRNEAINDGTGIGVVLFAQSVAPLTM